MTTRYQLTCSACNRRVPIETSQAGQTIPCECGATLRVPTMLKIKRLPLWGDNADAAPQSDEPLADVAVPEPSTVADAPRKTGENSGKRWGLFVVAAVFTLIAAFLFCANIAPVNPLGVFYKRVEYASGDGKTVRRDSSPINYLDYSFYFLEDPITKNIYYIDERLIDDMSFFHSYHYFDAVKKLDMSENFYEN